MTSRLSIPARYTYLRATMTDIEYLKSLQAVRDRAHMVLKAAEKDELTHFTYDASLMPKAAEFVAGIITVR